MVAAGALIALNNAIVKWMTAELSVGEVLFVRGVFVLVPVAVLAWHAGGLASLRMRSPAIQAVRAVLTVSSTFLFMFGLEILPLADCTAVAFAAPFFITALAARFLGERVGWRRWTAIAIGFAGIVVMTRPTGGAARWEVALPLAAAALTAARDVVTRRISTTETSVAMLCYTSLGMMLSGLATLPLGWRPVDLTGLGLLAAAGVLFALGHFLVIESYRRAEAGLVAPFKYTELVWATALGLAVWGALPDRWLLAGSVLVIASGLYILRRESRLRRRRVGVGDRSGRRQRVGTGFAPE